MRKHGALLILLLITIVVGFTACKSSKKTATTPTEAPKELVEVAPKNVNVSVEVTREIIAPVREDAKPNPIKLVPFVNVEDLLDLKGGMTMQEVTTKLGYKPFNVISNQADGYNIVTYKYKKVHIILNDQNENQIGAKGPKEFGSRIDDVYLMFNRDGKLELVISKEAYEGSPENTGLAVGLLKSHRNLYNPTKNDGKLMIKL